MELLVIGATAMMVLIQVVVMFFVYKARKYLIGKMREMINYLLFAAFMFFINCLLALIRKIFDLESLLPYERLFILIGLVVLLLTSFRMTGILRRGG